MERSLLCIILDTHPVSWNKLTHQWFPNHPQPSEVFPEVLERLIMFINASLSLREDNELFFVAAHPGQSRVIMSSEDRNDQRVQGSRRTDQYRRFVNVDQKLVTRLRDFLSHETDVSKDTSKYDPYFLLP